MDEKEKDILLKQAADALREIRVKAERWNYPLAIAALAELIRRGY